MADGLKGGRKRNTPTIKSVITVEQVKQQEREGAGKGRGCKSKQMLENRTTKMKKLCEREAQ